MWWTTISYESVKYLGVKIDSNLSWQYHVNDLFTKPKRANAALFKMRRYISLEILRSICIAISTPTYPNVILSGLIIVALCNELMTYVSLEILRSICIAILTLTYPTAILFGLIIEALCNELMRYVSLEILRSICIAISTLTYPTAILSGLIIVALCNELWTKLHIKIKQNFISKFQDKIWLDNIF